MRKYEVRDIDQKGAPIIKTGTSTYHIDDQELIPLGYFLEIVHNAPKVKKIYVRRIKL